MLDWFMDNVVSWILGLFVVGSITYAVAFIAVHIFAPEAVAKIEAGYIQNCRLMGDPVVNAAGKFEYCIVRKTDMDPMKVMSR